MDKIIDGLKRMLLAHPMVEAERRTIKAAIKAAIKALEKKPRK